MTLAAFVISLIALIATYINRLETKGNMDATERLSALVTKLNETITTEAAQQKTVVQELRDAINDGANAEKLNLIADDLEASIDRVAAIVPDEVSSPTDATPSDDSSTDVATGTEG
jgi:hypothetical protein